MQNRNSRLVVGRENACRIAARELLERAMVASPADIDLEVLAFKAAEKDGGLVIMEGGLSTAEGRLIAAPGKGGCIRVKEGLNPGRRRFTIAHEIGHYAMHPLVPHDREHLANADFTVWHDESEEAEANIFAAELLMPEFLLRPRIRGQEPSLQLLDQLSNEFSSSLLAVAIQYVAYTTEPVALVLSKGDKISWAKRSKDFWPKVQLGKIHAHSAAGERLSGKAGDAIKMVSSPAYAWLDGFERSNGDIMESSRYMDWYGQTISLLWLFEDLDED